MADWQGAQWVLAVILLMRPAISLAIRAAMIDGRAAMAKASVSLPDEKRIPVGLRSSSAFWGEWVGRRIADCGLVGILIWGGFF